MVIVSDGDVGYCLGCYVEAEVASGLGLEWQKT